MSVMDRRREPRVLLLLLGRAVAFWTFSVQPEQGMVHRFGGRLKHCIPLS